VICASIAGLACAWLLARGGYNVTVFGLVCRQAAMPAHIGFITTLMRTNGAFVRILFHVHRRDMLPQFVLFFKGPFASRPTAVKAAILVETGDSTLRAPMLITVGPV